MDLVRFGIDQIVATTVAFRLPGAFGTSVSVASLYDLTPTANGDLLIHNAASSFNLASGPIALFGTQPVSAFGTVEAGGSQINYSSRFGALQFDAVAVSGRDVGARRCSSGAIPDRPQHPWRTLPRRFFVGYGFYRDG